MLTHLKKHALMISMVTLVCLFTLFFLVNNIFYEYILISLTVINILKMIQILNQNNHNS